VFQLSLDLSRALEAGDLTLDDHRAGGRAGVRRAARPGTAPARLLGPPASAAPLAADDEDFEAFRARWERPQLHAVFTAHPTFLLAPAQAEAVAAAASSPGLSAMPPASSRQSAAPSRSITNTAPRWPPWPARRTRAM
jgi:phosphoenolpyruvate carboxylase